MIKSRSAAEARAARVTVGVQVLRSFGRQSCQPSFSNMKKSMIYLEPLFVLVIMRWFVQGETEAMRPGKSKSLHYSILLILGTTYTRNSASA